MCGQAGQQRQVECSVCVCTYKRPSVLDTIESVTNQLGIDGDRYEIIIVDDDPEKSAEPVIRALEKHIAFPVVRYVTSCSANIACARNVGLDAARGDWIAFIDDDEIAHPNWLMNLRETQARFDADIVKGRVQGVYPQGTPSWIRLGDPYSRQYGFDGQVPKWIASGNVLFRRSLVEYGGIRFRPEYGRSGGEDTDFFERLLDLGGKAVASRSAVVDEIVPDYRVTAEYLKLRCFRSGYTIACAIRSGSTKGVVLTRFLRALLVSILCCSYPALRLCGHVLAYKAFERFWYGMGFIRALLGGENRYAEEPYS